MLDAAVWGLACGFVADHWIGLIMAFGASTLISAIAYDLVEDAAASGRTLTLAAGLALGDTMMPEAFENGGRAVGLLTVLGFAVVFALSQLA